MFDNPRRINVKMYSHNHWNNREEVETNKEFNQQYYKDKCKVFT